MMTRWQRFKEAVKRFKQKQPLAWAAAKTGSAAFVMLSGKPIAEYLKEVADWSMAARSFGNFPQPDELFGVLVASAGAAITAAINFGWNKIMNNEIKYDKKDEG